MMTKYIKYQYGRPSFVMLIYTTTPHNVNFISMTGVVTRHFQCLHFTIISRQPQTNSISLNLISVLWRCYMKLPIGWVQKNGNNSMTIQMQKKTIVQSCEEQSELLLGQSKHKRNFLDNNQIEAIGCCLPSPCNIDCCVTGCSQ